MAFCLLSVQLWLHLSQYNETKKLPHETHAEELLEILAVLFFSTVAEKRG